MSVVLFFLYGSRESAINFNIFIPPPPGHYSHAHTNVNVPCVFTIHIHSTIPYLVLSCEIYLHFPLRQTPPDKPPGQTPPDKFTRTNSLPDKPPPRTKPPWPNKF